MKINEIFYSIQGESTFSGKPCIFVRTTYCNLRCTYCDTKYSYYEGEEKTISEILEKVKEFPCKLIELTGGEPLLQEDINELAIKLLSLGYTVLCETSGSLNIDKLDRRVYRIVDIKTPDSGEEAKNDYKNLERLSEKDELKFVICSRQDYLWAKEMVIEKKLTDKNTVLFSAEHENMNQRELAEWILEDGLSVRFQTQIHKLLWPNVERGI
jgi:7-carboxy-7-deazaguanine synthase